MNSGFDKENARPESISGSASPYGEKSSGDSGDDESLRAFADILEQILSQPHEHPETQVDPCQNDLLEVASRHSTLDFCVDPVLLELIRVVTRRIKGLSISRMQAMEHAVAASLIDDQISHGRLLNFWERLKRRDLNGQ